MSVVSAVPQNRKQAGGIWEFTLKAQLKADIAAGTKVRQHQDGDSYMYTAGAFKATDK